MRRYEDVTIKMYNSGWPRETRGAEYQLILEGPPDNVVKIIEDVYHTSGVYEKQIETILIEPEEILQKINMLGNGQVEYEAIIAILKARGVKDLIGCFSEIIRNRIKQIGSNEYYLSQIHFGLDVLIGDKNQQFKLAYPYTYESLRAMIERMLIWIRNNFKEQVQDEEKFELFSALPRDIQKVIANEFLDRTEDYKNLITTNKELSQLNHDYSRICSEPTKKEILEWILDKLANLKEGERITIQFKYGEYVRFLKISEEEYLILRKKDNRSIIESVHEYDPGPRKVKELDTINSIWKKLDILGNGITEYQMMLDILSNREQLRQRGQEVNCFLDLIRDRLKPILDYAEILEDDENFSYEEKINNYYALDRVFNGLLGLLHEEDRQFYLNGAADKVKVIYEVMEFIRDNF